MEPVEVAVITSQLGRSGDRRSHDWAQTQDLHSLAEFQLCKLSIPATVLCLPSPYVQQYIAIYEIAVFMRAVTGFPLSCA